jgi:hypothetical protein
VTKSWKPEGCAEFVKWPMNNRDQKKEHKTEARVGPVTPLSADNQQHAGKLTKRFETSKVTYSKQLQSLSKIHKYSWLVDPKATKHQMSILNVGERDFRMF